MPRPIHFEIHASNPERAIAFYSGLFGWKFQKWDGPMPYWMVMTGEGPGIDGGLMPRQGPEPTHGQAVNAYPCTVGVDDVDASTAKAEKLGAKVVVPKMEIPGVGWLVYVVETEGNILGMMQAMNK